MEPTVQPKKQQSNRDDKECRNLIYQTEQKPAPGMIDPDTGIL